MYKMIIIGLLPVLAALVLLPSPAHALYTQPASTIAGGGGAAASANYSNIAVIAQPGIVGNSLSASYAADHGFLPVMGGWHILYPVISATPGTLTFTLASGATSNQPLAVANTGGSTLKWSVAKGNASETYFTFSPSTGSGDASVTVTANAAGLAPNTYSDTLTVSGTGVSQAVQVQLSLTVTQGGTYRLTMTVVSDTAGKGGGLVYNAASGISCSNTGTDLNTQVGTCYADFSPGTTVTLMQSPDSNSTYAIWSLTGCVTGQNCQVTMNGNQPVTATFPYAHMAKVNSSGQRYDTLADTLSHAAGTDTILARDVTFNEYLTISGNKTVTLLGGRDAWYNPLNADTVLQGSLTVQSGSLTVDKLVIK